MKNGKHAELIKRIIKNDALLNTYSVGNRKYENFNLFKFEVINFIAH